MTEDLQLFEKKYQRKLIQQNEKAQAQRLDR
jgi:hypothetical protein